jgi:antitoxin MazE
MKTRIIRIGNSQGIRIPKALLEQSRLSEEVELHAAPGELIIRPVRSPREGWEEQFRRMAECGDDRLLDGDSSLTEWDETEWQWE